MGKYKIRSPILVYFYFLLPEGWSSVLCIYIHSTKEYITDSLYRRFASQSWMKQ
jgi:hypothetical protein